MPKLVDVICTNCPMGCNMILTIDEENNNVIKIMGNKCKQGEKYALAEYKNPVRVLTATVKTISDRNPLLSVKTNKPVPKDKMRELMYSLAKIKVKTPLEIGQVVKSNIIGMDVDLVATSDFMNY